MVKNLKYLCILGGGAVRGFSYLGVLKAMAELEIMPKSFAGSSVGAVFSAFWAVGVPFDTINEVLMDVNFELFKDLNISFTPDFAISKGNLFTEWLRENFEKAHYKGLYKKGENPPVTFKDIDNDLIIIASNLSDCTPFIFSKKATPDFEIAEAVRISASLPGLFKPVQHGEYLLSDGDLMKSWPMWRLGDCLCPESHRILEFRLEGLKQDTKNKNALEYINTIYSCLSNYATDFIMDLYGFRDKFDYIKIDTKDLLVVNFNISKEEKQKLLNIGYETTMDFFKKELPLKKKKIADDYKSIINHLTGIKNCIEKNKINNAKDILGDLFMGLCEIKNEIDMMHYDEIIAFRELFMKNLQKTVWQNYSMTNKNLVSANLLLLIRKLDKKYDELSSYSV